MIDAIFKDIVTFCSVFNKKGIQNVEFFHQINLAFCPNINFRPDTIFFSGKGESSVSNICEYSSKIEDAIEGILLFKK